MRSPQPTLGENRGERLSTARERHSLPYGSKRALDLFVAVPFVLLSAPLVVLISAAILLDSGRPVLFKSGRLGLAGRQFTMYKFRTMVRDAEARLESIAGQDIGEGMVKIVDDPRVTRVGAWLRRYSLDELPQLWNVVRGEMSVVGPRPHNATEIVVDAPEHVERMSVRPGLTGLWQIRARSDPSLASRVYWDLRYVASCSFSLDLRIIAETVPVVLGGLGARVGVPNSQGPRAVAAGLGQVPPPTQSSGNPS